MALSILNAEYFWRNARSEALLRRSGAGKAALDFYDRLFLEVEDPRRPFLTDVGVLDIRQGERTVFGDPWKFKLMAENGQIDTTVIQKNIDNEYYDLIFCQRDLFSPEYETFEFGLPRVLVQRSASSLPTRPLQVRALRLRQARRPAMINLCADRP